MACLARLLRVIVGETEKFNFQALNPLYHFGIFCLGNRQRSTPAVFRLARFVLLLIAMTRDIAKREPLLPPEPAIRNVLSGCSATATLLRLQLRSAQRAVGVMYSSDILLILHVLLNDFERCTANG